MSDTRDAPASAYPSRDSYRKDLSRRFRRALSLTLASTVLPGAGLTRTRLSKLGLLITAAAVIGLAVVGYLVLTQGVKAFALSLASRPTALLWVGILFVVGGLIWCIGIALTAWAARPSDLDRTRTRALAVFATLLIGIVGFASYQASALFWTTKQTVTQVFQADPERGGNDVKIVEGEDPWKYTPRVSILLMGSDTRNEGDGVRTDTMMVASIDTKTGRTVLISLPRNLQHSPLAKDSPLRENYPSGYYGTPSCLSDDGECMLNGIWTSAENLKAADPKAYPGIAVPGRNETRDTIEAITGLRIDHTVVVDFTAFTKLVDAMGGIEMYVKLSGYGTPLPIEGYLNANGRLVGEKGYFTPGEQRLNGYHALWYARARAADDDFFRQQRQRCVVRAIVQQVNPAGMLTKYAEIGEILRNNIYTDIPAENLPAYVELVNRIQTAPIVSAPLTPADGIEPGRPDYELIREIIDKQVNPPAPVTSTGTGTPAPSTTSTPAQTTTPESTTTTTSAPVDECAPTPADLEAVAKLATASATTKATTR